MSLRSTVNRFLKRIGAYTISDEDLALSEIYESLPREERQILDRVSRKQQSFEEAGRRMGLTPEEARALYDRAFKHIDERVVQLSQREPAH